MTRNTRNVLIVLAFLGTFGAGAGADRVIAQTPERVVQIVPQAVNCPEVKVTIDPCVCNCTTDAATVCPDVRVEVVPATHRAAPQHDYWLDLLLTAGNESGTASVVYNRWKRFRPVVSLSYVDSYHQSVNLGEALRTRPWYYWENSYGYDLDPVPFTVEAEWRVEAGVAVALWKK